MAGTIFLLRSKPNVGKPNETYIGCSTTKDIDTALKTHNDGNGKHTKKLRPLDLALWAQNVPFVHQLECLIKNKPDKTKGAIKLSKTGPEVYANYKKLIDAHKLDSVLEPLSRTQKKAAIVLHALKHHILDTDEKAAVTVYSAIDIPSSFLTALEPNFEIVLRPCTWQTEDGPEKQSCSAKQVAAKELALEKRKRSQDEESTERPVTKKPRCDA